jgi:hypothetical protein
MDESTKNLVTLIVAIFGVIQVWFIALWKKYYKRGKVEIYETGNVEIGYSAFGPTLGLNGTLRALDKEVFIQSIDLLIVRERDKAQHNFRWLAFRPPKIELSGSQPITLEIPSGFLISPNLPHRFNISFNDNIYFDDIRILFNEYFTEWNKVAEQLNKIGSSLYGKIPLPGEASNQFNILEDFRKCQSYTNIFAKLNKKCYWECGDYSLTMNVKTSKPDKVFNKNYRFHLSEDDSKMLLLNVITILEEPIANYLRIRNYPYYFAYSDYK